MPSMVAALMTPLMPGAGPPPTRIASLPLFGPFIISNVNRYAIALQFSNHRWTLRACLRNPLPLLLWRRGLGRGGPFLTRALHALAIFRHALRKPALLYHIRRNSQDSKTFSLGSLIHPFFSCFDLTCLL